ncbi:MAG: hypothetical protein IJL58_05760 [Bacteroidales bacterium]|nr:hypothetical protein [Bacteroidales bacterium]
MDKKQILIDLIDNYKQSILGPVNPFTVDNADALIYNGRSLIGLYIPLKKELSNPDLLLRRLFLSRLSMSKVVSTLLILSEEDAHAFDSLPEVHASFDALYIYENDRDLLSYLRKEIQQRNPILSSIRRQRIRRFWGTIDFIERNGIVQNVYDGQDAMLELKVRSWSNPNRERCKKATDYTHPFLVASKKRTKQSFKDGYDDLMTVTAMFNYSMSDGMLKKNKEADDTFMFLNIEALEDVSRNEMNLRTMVFLGYLPGRIGRDYSLGRLRDQYYSFMNEKRYW